MSRDFVVSEVCKYWELSNIPTMCLWRIKENVLNFFQSYKGLTKNINRDTEKEKNKRQNFKNNLEKLFDIAAQNAEEVLTKDRLKMLKGKMKI